MPKKNELIVTFLHANYLKETAGTEQFVSMLSKCMQDQGFDHLVFFPVVSASKKRGVHLSGMIYNDAFQGIIQSRSIKDAVYAYLEQYGLKLNAFHVQHLKHCSLKDIQNTIKRYEAEVFVFLHDYYSICISHNLLDHEGHYCGAGKVSEEKCRNCKYHDKALEHSRRMEAFYEEITPRVRSVIAPSESVKRMYLQSFPQLNQLIVIRPHLRLSGKKKMSSLEGKLRVAFPGRQSEKKGYGEWLKLLNTIMPETGNACEFYYLGMDHGKTESVTNRYVSTAHQGREAMRECMEKNNISCAFLFPQCPETYSYVFYDLLVSGAFVLTNEISGNIRDEVEKYKNGIIFSDVRECAEWLSDTENVRNTINRFREHGNSIPDVYETNDDLSAIVAVKTANTGQHEYGEIKRERMLTALYILRYYRFLSGRCRNNHP